MVYFIMGALPSPYVEVGQPFMLGDINYPPDWLEKAGPDSVGATPAPAFDASSEVLERSIDGWVIRSKSANELATELVSAQQAASASIKQQAQKARGQWSTPGKDGVYLEKLHQADEWETAGSPEDLAAYPYIEAEIGVTANTAGELVALWRQRRQLCAQAGAAIERIEKEVLKAIASATTFSEIQGAIDGLNWPTPQ
jgi:hypothetical protein